MYKKRITCPEIVYLKGEEMTRYTMDLFLQKCILPHINIDKWHFYDLSCKNRDNTNDDVLINAINKGKQIRSIFKEPTITPTEIQKKTLNLKNTLMSPNGLMRNEWNGFTVLLYAHCSIRLAHLLQIYRVCLKPKDFFRIKRLQIEKINYLTTRYLSSRAR